jgi:DNA polymerase V
MDKIIAIADCNNFYVSCERLFDPSLKIRPTVVLTNNDGSVISRSAEVKKLGVKKGEKFFNIREIARKRGIKYFSSNYTLYADISERVFSIIKNEIQIVEVYSIDEVFFDLSHMKLEKIPDFLKNLRDRVLKESGIPISIGAASNKTLAKLANKISKSSDGVCVISNRQKFLEENTSHLELDDVWGIGERSKKKILDLGCKNIIDFINFSPSIIRKKLTITGLRTQMELGGIRCFDVETTFKPKKNISTSRTFGYSLSDLNQLQKATHLYVVKACLKLKRERALAQSFVLSVCNDPHKEDSYYSESFKVKLIRASQDEDEIWSQVQDVLIKKYRADVRYRKSSVRLTEIIPVGMSQSILFGNLIKPSFYEEPIGNEWQMRRDFLSKRFTSRWDEIPSVNLIEI